MYATATVMPFIFLYLRNVDLYFIAIFFTIFSINILIANVKDVHKRNKIWHTFELFFIYLCLCNVLCFYLSQWHIFPKASSVVLFLFLIWSFASHRKNQIQHFLNIMLFTRLQKLLVYNRPRVKLTNSF